jgi:hypothetical protein
MYAQLIEAHAQVLLEERRREAEHQRLVDLASGPRRPIRARIAGLLVVAAEWVEGNPGQRIAPAADSA